MVTSQSTPDSYTPTTPSIGQSIDGSTRSTGNVYNLTQYALDRLKQLTDYVKRYQLVGDRTLDRFFSRFGIKLPSAKLDRSEYIGMHKFDISIGEVMATADSTVEGEITNVGDYAGKGNGYGSGHFSYKTDEFGYLIIISVVRPHIGYGQGRPRFLQHINRMDFFQPEFDYGVQPIRQDELFADFFTEENQAWNSYGAFGFTSQYAEYKTQPHDGLSGDFVLGSKNVGWSQNMHLLRLFNQSDDLHINEAFTIGDNGQFDRIFNSTDSWDDHFMTVYHFDVESWAPLRKMFDDYDFDPAKSVSMDIGGTALD